MNANKWRNPFSLHRKFLKIVGKLGAFIKLTQDEDSERSLDKLS